MKNSFGAAYAHAVRLCLEVCKTPNAFATRFDATSRALFPQLIELGRGRQRCGSSTVFFRSIAATIVSWFRFLRPSNVPFPQVITVCQLHDLIASYDSPDAFVRDALNYRHAERARL